MSAGDGLPGAYRVVVKPGVAGIWRFEARWTGRKLAGMRVENAQGEVLVRTAGSTPLTLQLTIDDKMVRAGERLLLRFAPMVTRGALDGTLEVAGPEDPAARQAPRPKKKELPSWPMSCLPPVDENTQKPTPEMQTLAFFAESLRDASQEEAIWAKRWLQELNSALSVPSETQLRREALDALWERLPLDPPPSEEIARPFRAMLGAMEDLVRREAAKPNPALVAARREASVKILACLLEDSR